MRVLVACEFSGVVREAFAARGHDAWSCGLLPSELPGQHYQCDVREVLGLGWDLMIAHPPCTYLSGAGARWLYKKIGQVDLERLERGMEARYFFLELLHCSIPKIAVENPRQLTIFKMPRHSQEVQPYYFGDSYTKATRLWLKGVPPLWPTKIVDKGARWIDPHGVSRPAWYMWAKGRGYDGGHSRSRTFPGIAAAMAAQWG